MKIVNRNLDVMHSIHHTLVAIHVHSILQLGLGYSHVTPWWHVDAKAGWQILMLNSTGLAFPSHELGHVSKAERKLRHAGPMTIKDIEAGRVYAKNLLAYAAQIEKANPGTIEAEWLESWYLNRVLLGPLTELEKKITSAETPAK